MPTLLVINTSLSSWMCYFELKTILLQLYNIYAFQEVSKRRKNTSK